jgi:hypothetical protein
MNSFYCSVGSADGKFSEIFVWAESIVEAEELVIFECVTNYFKEKNCTPTNFYTKDLRKRSRQKSEFPITIHHNLFNFDDSEVFFITVRKCTDIKLNLRPTMYS